MATQQATSTAPFEAALALATSKGSDVLTSKLGMMLVALPAYKDFIRQWVSVDWPDDYQAMGEINIVRAIGILLAAGVIYGQLFGGMASPLMIALVASPAEAIQ